MTAITADLQFDRFYRYEDFTDLLHAFAREYPGLVSVESIGKSHEGRDIWVVTVTNFATGSAHTKPAFWLDANIHAIEVAGGAAALYFIKQLVQGHGRDTSAGERDITRALDTRAFYICPRFNPDGVEAALADTPHFVRSSMRPYPDNYLFAADPVDGMTVQDIDGNGRILTMRIPDSNGPWKQHPEDARLMIRRDPAEVGGKYFRVIPEGLIANYDGLKFKVNANREALDLNRNFPAGWRQEFDQLGAGDFPTSEPEVRAVVEFINRHRNIGAGTSLHTFSGVLLRPFSMYNDDTMAPEDLWVYKKVGKKGTEITGYPNISTYHDFRYHPTQVISGTFDWMFDHMGAFSWTIEIWCPMKEAGITEYDYIDWFRDHSPEDDLKMLRWSDTTLGGAGYHDWKPFEHPQLGAVEIGGWDKFRVIHNPPAQLLEKEIAKFPPWLLWQALILPKLEVREVRAERIDAGAGSRDAVPLWRVRVAVQNTGWLPTSVTERAVTRKVVNPIQADIRMSANCVLGTGLPRQILGQLAGWSGKHTAVSFWPDADPMGDVGVAEWIVAGPAGEQLDVAISSERAGSMTLKVVLGQ
jgi:murein tripeptide amidase MpaA